MILKCLTYTVLLLSMISCDKTTEKQKQKPERKVKTFDSDLNGIWGLTHYFDSIVVNKELAKYRLRIPTWFGILIEIKNDSLFAYGSIYTHKKKLNFSSDTLTSFESFGGDWFLIKKNKRLSLTKFPNDERPDSTVYIYEMRKDFKSLIKGNFQERITNYFNKKLLSGKYKNTMTKEKIELKPDGSLIGFKGFDKYAIRPYFGTFHPYNNLDVVYFINSKTNESKDYNWVIDKQKLTLIEFEAERGDYNEDGRIDDTEIGMYRVLGKEKMELIKPEG